MVHGKMVTYGRMASILIIEDDPLIALALEYLVKDMGHVVIGSAARTAQAERLASDRAPDLVLADIRLAGGDDGIDTVRSLRRKHDFPVIFITGQASEFDLEEREEMPTDIAAIVAKPFDPFALRSVIDGALVP